MTKQNNEVLEVQEVAVENEVVTVSSDEISQAVAFDASLFQANNTAVISSLSTQDRASKIKVYNAVSNADANISDMLKETIEVTDFVAHPIRMADEQTGEMIDATRVILIGPNGAYHSTSTGVVQSVQRIIGLVGTPTWEPALKIMPVEVKTRRGFKTITLNVVE